MEENNDPNPENVRQNDAPPDSARYSVRVEDSLNALADSCLEYIVHKIEEEDQMEAEMQAMQQVPMVNATDRAHVQHCGGAVELAVILETRTDAGVCVG